MRYTFPLSPSSLSPSIGEIHRVIIYSKSSDTIHETDTFFAEVIANTVECYDKRRFITQYRNVQLKTQMIEFLRSSFHETFHKHERFLIVTSTIFDRICNALILIRRSMRRMTEILGPTITQQYVRVVDKNRLQVSLGDTLLTSFYALY